MGWLGDRFKIRAAAGSPEKPRLATSMDGIMLAAMMNDAVADKKGLEIYRYMGRDAEVAADTDIRLVGMMPGIQLLPPDDTEEAKRSALLCDSVLSAMDGAMLATIRDEMLREAVQMGFMVAEPIQRVIDLPEFGGPIMGLKSIRVRPAEGFADSIRLDDSGDIEEFKQVTGAGSRVVTPDQVIYYAFHGTPWNPYGRSVYHAAYDYWLLKRTLHRLYTVFSTVNASGIREYEIPDDLFDKDAAAALDRLKKMAESPNIVRKTSHKLELHIPPGTAGMHYINGIKMLCNAEIKKAILYDEVFNSEGQKTGSYASKQVSQDTVSEAMAAQGWAFCEVMQEQILRRILDWNGYTSWPTPKLIPEPAAKRDQATPELLMALGNLYTTGVLSKRIPEDSQDQLLRQMLRPMGVDYTPTDSAPEPDETPEGEAAAHRHIAASAPKGRGRADVLRMKREAVKAEGEGVEVAADGWSGMVPSIVKGLTGSLFNPDGTWKSRDYGTIRESIDKAVSSHGTKLRQGLTDVLWKRWESGENDAADMLPAKSAVRVTPVRITPTAAQAMLRQRVYLILRDTYGSVSDSLYYQIENALNGNLSAQQVIPQIRQTLTEAGITPGRARTILSTAMSTAYNQGRMSLFSTLSDPDGSTPGGIIGYELSAVIDDETTPTCEELNNRFFRVDDPNLPQPPLHYNCRSVLIPVFSGEKPWNADGSWVSLDKSKGMTAGIEPGFGGM